jgi:hypothetical protein
MACRAADIVTALPPGDIYSRMPQDQMLGIAYITRFALALFNAAAVVLDDPKCYSPFMPAAPLMGGCLTVLQTANSL